MKGQRFLPLLPYACELPDARSLATHDFPITKRMNSKRTQKFVAPQ